MSQLKIFCTPVLTSLLLFVNAKGQCGNPGTGGLAVVGSPTPSTLTPRADQTVSVTVRNTSSIHSWYPGCENSTGGDYVMLQRFSPDPSTLVDAGAWLPLRVSLTEVVPPGGTYTFRFRVSPPKSAENRSFTVTYRLVAPRCSWPGSGILSRFNSNYCPEGSLTQFSGTITWNISLGATSAPPPAISDLIGESTWDHPIGGAFNVYDFPMTQNYKPTPQVPWEGGYCPAYSNFCGETYLLVDPWQDWSRNYIPLELQGRVHPDLTKDPDVGWRMRVFSNHPLVAGVDGDGRPIPNMERPVIITQGFDPGHGTEDEFDYDDFADQLIREFRRDPPFTEITNVSDNLLRRMYNDGREIVLVRFKNPNEKIEDNSRIVQAVTATLQTQMMKNSGSYQYSDSPIRVIGPSMGGLVCRHALQTFQSRWDFGGQPPPNIANFLAFDSPNRGAVIPMPLQAFVQLLTQYNSDANAIYSNLVGRAAREMLLYTVPDGLVNALQDPPGTGIKNTRVNILDYEGDLVVDKGGSNVERIRGEHARFMDEMNSALAAQAIVDYHYPVNSTRHIRMAAISNGSGLAETQGLPDAGMIGTARIEVALAGVTVGDATLRASTSGNSTSNVVFDVPESILYGLPLRLFLGEPAFTENVPGGGRGTYRIINRTWENAEPAFTNTFWLNVNSVFLDNNHAFIPTLSALGLRKESGWDVNRPSHLLSRFNDNIGSLASESLFGHLYVPFHNQEHVMVTDENKMWLGCEMVASYTDRDCGR